MNDSKKQPELEKLKKQCEEYLNGWKRAQADLINYKKEEEKHQQEFKDFVVADVILDLLLIHDHFKRALNVIPKNPSDEWLVTSDSKTWIEGIKHIKSQLDKFLADRGVIEIKTVGEKFNPEFHEAVDKRQVANTESDQVLEECATGYTLNGKVIMPAKVIVNE